MAVMSDSPVAIAVVVHAKATIRRASRTRYGHLLQGQAQYRPASEGYARNLGACCDASEAALIRFCNRCALRAGDGRSTRNKRPPMGRPFRSASMHFDQRE